LDSALRLFGRGGVWFQDTVIHKPAFREIGNKSVGEALFADGCSIGRNL
jgi:hypothetical protein